MISKNWSQFSYRVKESYRSPPWFFFTVILAGGIALGIAAMTADSTQHPFLRAAIVFFTEVLVLTVIGGLLGGITYDAIDRGELTFERKE